MLDTRKKKLSILDLVEYSGRIDRSADKDKYFYGRGYWRTLCVTLRDYWHTAPGMEPMKTRVCAKGPVPVNNNGSKSLLKMQLF